MGRPGVESLKQLSEQLVKACERNVVCGTTAGIVTVLWSFRARLELEYN
jgi:hypothetical protein